MPAMRLSAAIAIGMFALSSAAQAETLPIAGVYPGGSDLAASVQSIAVADFGGVDGQTLGLRIEDLLRDVYIYRRPWFAMVPAAGGVEADAILRGTAGADVTHYDITLIRNRCVQRDEDRKCLEYKDIEVDCLRRLVTFSWSVRLVRREGELVFGADGAPQQQLDYCPRDDENVKTVEATVAELVQQVASGLRYDLAPYESRQDVRVMESRKGLKGDVSKRFKAAVTLTKTDVNAACASWEQIGLEMPGHLSTAFNRGLCAEWLGQLDLAETHYRAALQLSPGDDYSNSGLRRIELRRRADWQLAAHYTE
jgi:hypothetical protein